MHHAATDAVINITTGGAITMTLDQRLAAALDISAEMASCNMGSINFAIFPMLEKMKEFKHPWERDYIAGTRAATSSAIRSPTLRKCSSAWAKAMARDSHRCNRTQTCHAHAKDLAAQCLSENERDTHVCFREAISTRSRHVSSAERLADAVLVAKYQTPEGLPGGECVLTR